ncbi:DUF2281 domain-containing protein [Synechocystis sp. CS-94]|nr:DUF2281 domain-containing protein [Synechocystis sp. CS-94]
MAIAFCLAGDSNYKKYQSRIETEPQLKRNPMTDTALLEKINALPDAMKLEVEHFVEFLLAKQTHISPEQALSSHQTNTSKKRDGFGILKGKIWMADDFDAPLEEMQEYM